MVKENNLHKQNAAQHYINGQSNASPSNVDDPNATGDSTNSQAQNPQGVPNQAGVFQFPF
jgi:hypothetical protein